MLSQSMIMAYHATSLWAWNRLSLPNNWQIDIMYRVKIWVQENTKQQNSFHPQSYLVAYIQVAEIQHMGRAHMDFNIVIKNQKLKQTVNFVYVGGNSVQRKELFQMSRGVHT